MGEILIVVLKVLFILVALIMTFFILLQEGKGGGLAGLGGTKAAGVEGVTNPIRRATAVLSIIFFLLAVLLGVMARPKDKGKADGLFDASGADVKAEMPTDEKAVGPVMPVAPEEKKAGEPTKSETPASTDATDKPADKPAEKPVEKPAEKTETKPAAPEGAAAKTEEKPAEKPAPAPVAAPATPEEKKNP
jgi:protein translocase SecG subunit